MGLKPFRIRDLFRRDDSNNNNNDDGVVENPPETSLIIPSSTTTKERRPTVMNDNPSKKQIHVLHGHIGIVNPKQSNPNEISTPVPADSQQQQEKEQQQQQRPKLNFPFLSDPQDNDDNHRGGQQDSKRQQLSSLQQQQQPRKQGGRHHRMFTSAAAEADHDGNGPETNYDTVYDFYRQNIIPAIISSFPILMGRLWEDVGRWMIAAAHNLYLFILPTWMKENMYLEQVQEQLHHQQHQAQLLWEQAIESSKNLTIAEFVRNQFDTNNTDGGRYISTSELMNFTESLLSRLPTLRPTAVENDGTTTPTGDGSSSSISSLSFLSFISREWPLMDWKIGKLLWHTFGGLLLVIAVLSIVPGRLHSWSGRILRWPVLALTYILISIELVVYIMIRLGIRIVETFFQIPKHRQLRRKMAQSATYEEWYSFAAALDLSQRRDKWQRTVDDADAVQYNWPLIRQLMADMKEARHRNDPIQAMAVLQQCSRKNAGGIMSEELFTKTYTGEPKFVVIEFITEVNKTLKWVTDQTLRKEEIQREMEHLQNEERRNNNTKKDDQQRYKKKLERKSRNEHDKIWRSLVAFATLTLNNDSSNDDDDENNEHSNGQQTTAENNGSGGIVTTDPIAAATAARQSLSNLVQDLNELSIDEASSRSNTNGNDIPGCPRDQLLVFMKRARAAYGRTALCLSGGAMMGLYHIGHLQGLMETDSLPHICSGCSAGSVIGAVLCTRTNEELARDLQPQVIGPKMKCFQRSWPERIVSVWKTGNLFSGDEWQEMIRWFACGDMTFEEAYLKTGRILCISLSPTSKKTPPILLNYVSAPHVTIGSAVVASAAVPGFVTPQHLRIKDSEGNVSIAGPETYFDGSIRHDIPTAGLSEMLNCQFFVACQANPHIVPFFFNPKGGVGKPSRWLGGQEDMAWRGGFLLSAMEMYLKSSMKSKFTFLRDLDAAVGFTGTMMTQSFEGSTTIVPQVQLRDFFVLFTDPTVDQLYRYLQTGKVAAYQHAAMIRLHYRIADALDECIERLEDWNVVDDGNDVLGNSQQGSTSGSKSGGESGGETTTGRKPRRRVKVSRRASFEVTKAISNAVLNADRKHRDDTSSSPVASGPQSNGRIRSRPNNGSRDSFTIPKVVSAALNDRMLDECDSSSTQSLSNESK